MENDLKIFDAFLQIIYKETNPQNLLTALKEMTTSVSSLNIRDELKLSVFHHLCVISDKLESHPEILKEILILLLKPDKRVQDNYQIFAGFPSSENDSQEIKVEFLFDQ